MRSVRPDTVKEIHRKFNVLLVSCFIDWSSISTTNHQFLTSLVCLPRNQRYQKSIDPFTFWLMSLFELLEIGGISLILYIKEAKIRMVDQATWNLMCEIIFWHERYTGSICLVARYLEGTAHGGRGTKAVNKYSKSTQFFKGEKLDYCCSGHGATSGEEEAFIYHGLYLLLRNKIVNGKLRELQTCMHMNLLVIFIYLFI